MFRGFAGMRQATATSAPLLVSGQDPIHPIQSGEPHAIEYHLLDVRAFLSTMRTISRYGNLLLCLFLLQGLIAALSSPEGDAKFGRPICWSKRRLPPIITRSRTPRPKDIEAIIQQYKDEDTQRPPANYSFAEQGEFPRGEVDFELPMLKRHITCVANLAMRRSSPNKKAYASIELVIEAMEYIKEECTTPDWVGGIVAINKDLAVAYNGQRLSALGVTNGTSFKESEGQVNASDFARDWTDEMFRALDQQDRTVVNIS